jgi:hypothetical protein
MAARISTKFEDFIQKKIDDPFGPPPTPEQIEEATKEKLKQLRAESQLMALRRVNELEQVWEQNRKRMAEAYAAPGVYKPDMGREASEWMKSAEGNDNMALQYMLESALAGKQMHFTIGSNLSGPIIKDDSEKRRMLEEQDRQRRDLIAKYGERGFMDLLANLQNGQQAEE